MELQVGYYVMTKDGSIYGPLRQDEYLDDTFDGSFVYSPRIIHSSFAQQWNSNGKPTSSTADHRKYVTAIAKTVEELKNLKISD